MSELLYCYDSRSSQPPITYDESDPTDRHHCTHLDSTLLSSDSVDSYNITWMYTGPCMDTGLPLEYAQVNGSVRDYTVASLQPNAEYEVTVVAINRGGSASESITVHTSVFCKLDCFKGFLHTCDHA